MMMHGDMEESLGLVHRSQMSREEEKAQKRFEAGLAAAASIAA
jgi:hypothetical protein